MQESWLRIATAKLATAHNALSLANIFGIYGTLH
jgi:hypothetical protein